VAERRLLLARQDERIVGLAAVVPVYARGGWFVEDLIRMPDAPNGTTELLVDAAMRDAAALGSRYLTLGLAPLAGDVPLLLGLARRYAAPLYDFRGLGAFKAKFRPSQWVPIHLSYPSTQSAWLAVYHCLRAFSRRGLLRYGIETLLRGPDVVLRGLAFLLLPWTLLLALLDGERWFPEPWVQWAWVAFDLASCVALLSLGHRFRPWLSRFLVGLVTLDAALTLAQALVFNLPRLQSIGDALGVAIAVAAPAVASRILANAHHRAARVWAFRREKRS
jgi:phosphatidylglycerol lysyltransferase